jgi:RNA polymerase sigma-70 factor (ECF subfamily)
VGVRTPESDLKALMLASLAGDASAYRTLLELLEREFAPFFRRRLADDAAEAADLVQETLIAIHTRRGTYDRSQPFTAWTYAIARHKLVDHYRRRGRASMIPLDDGGDLLAADETAGAEAKQDVEKALSRLPTATQSLIRDIKLRELSHAEAARLRGMSETAAKVAVHRGMKKLAGFLRPQKESPP